jgi:hypothetical protein
MQGIWANSSKVEASAPPLSQSADAPVSTTRFSIARNDSGWWLVSPTGQPFFSAGVCCVSQGLSRENFDPDNPGYAAWQRYPDAAHWADTTLSRMKSWGFTTVGGWGDYDPLRHSPEMVPAFTPVLHMGSTAGAPWWDMWDTNIIGRMETVAREQILAWRDDPHLLGYYSDNELGWWNAALFKMTLEQSSTSGQRRQLLKLLRDTYHNDWNNLLKDFQPENARDWKGLDKAGMLYLRPGSEGIHVMRQFLGVVAARYYQLVHQIIRKYDQRALILGDRYQSFYYPEVAKACAPYVDVVSSNLNASWNDGTFARFYLDTLHALTGKPILISEFYMAAAENRSGNRNNHGGFPVVTTQRERADGMRNTLAALLRLPYVVGADWFQYADEPTHGRDDGENFNFGLVDINDRPYETVTEVPAQMNFNRLKARTGSLRADASQGVPPAPRDPLYQFDANRALKNWDRERGFVKPASAFPMADLYICWSPQAIYLGLFALDFIEDSYYAGRAVPKSDRPLWLVQVNGGEPVRARLGGGREPLVNDPAVQVQNLSGLNLNVRNVAFMELPARRLGREKLKAGEVVDFTATLQAHCRAYQADWKGSFTLIE